STTDIDGDQIYYLFDWGDGNDSGWMGPYNSGDICKESHIWSTKGNYAVKVKAKDTFGAESPWSDPLPITMPYSYNPIQLFLELLFQRFPNAFPILRHLLGY
ncbi:MAG: PKD domain-containing protein, partial [Euryarchaeota archaeon]|nr:PKD domain-containing protein [Euryarchaeota archaeon]